jgi:hypothetical protein
MVSTQNACVEGRKIEGRANDQHRQELLRSSATYAMAKLAFANAIVIAQRAGETDEEIAHACGTRCR